MFQPPADYLDGCTMFPDELNGVDISPCCDAHDTSYWYAETLEQKFQADAELYQCVIDTGGFDLFWIIVGCIMFAGVSTVGTYFWYNKDKRWKNNED